MFYFDKMVFEICFSGSVTNSGNKSIRAVTVLQSHKEVKIEGRNYKRCDFDVMT